MSRASAEYPREDRDDNNDVDGNNRPPAAA